MSIILNCIVLGIIIEGTARYFDFRRYTLPTLLLTNVVLSFSLVMSDISVFIAADDLMAGFMIGALNFWKLNAWAFPTK